MKPLFGRAVNRTALVTALLLTAAVITFNYFDLAAKAQRKEARIDQPMAGTITGRVFQDFNGNGLYETGGGTAAAPAAVDSGTANVTVSAYDAGGVLRGTATTAADGTYSLAATGTGPYRIEFTNLPTGYLPSARSSSSEGAGTATNAGSTVRFVNDGNTGNVNLAINRPGDYCENNPVMCSQLYGVGDATQDDAVFTIPYYAGSTRTTGGTPVTDFTSPGNTSLATTDQVGTTFGIAYQRSSRRVFVSAVMKKHTKFGPGGPGAIYVIDRNSGVVSEYANLNTIFGAGTAGTDPHNPLDYNTDNGQATWNAVGKIAFGGMAMSADEQYLFAMNLANRRLYRIPTSGPLDSTTITSYPFPTTMPNCTTAPALDIRPFAVAWYEDSIYVGAVCSRENFTTVDPSGNLRAYVYRFNPTTLTFAGTPDINVQLNYTRLETDPGYSARWRNWRTSYTTLSASHFIYPQPMFTDLDFDRGNMIISLRDRNGDQSGYNSASNPSNSSQLFKGITAGDILRACGNPTSGWTLESNGRCASIGGAPQNTNEGPGGGEYYYQDNYHPNGNPHDEVGVGGASQIPGHNVLVATMFDPTYIPNDNIYDAGGFRWFNNSTGAQNRGYLAYSLSDFGKANGIGNVHPLCEASPIEIGNRVWRDSNSNGVQDPGEPPLAGVTVRLYLGSVLIATAVTDANGEYYFISASSIDPNTTDNIGWVNGGIQYNTAYQVRADNPANYGISGPLFGLQATSPFQTSQAGDDVSSDSNAITTANPSGSPAGVFPVVFVTTGGQGNNDHRFDIGFRLAPAAANVSISGSVRTATGLPLRSIAVTLSDMNGNVRTAYTSSFGYYSFEDVLAGSTYFVEVHARKYSFSVPVRTVVADDKIADVDFYADMQ